MRLQATASGSKVGKALPETCAHNVQPHRIIAGWAAARLQGQVPGSRSLASMEFLLNVQAS